MTDSREQIQQMDDAAQFLVSGGDYVERSLGLICGIALAAGFLGSGGLLGLALAGGAVLVAVDA
jgi:hypothetical protein